MMRALYIAQTGMESSQFQVDIVTNNLANINTIGFKRVIGLFIDLPYQTLRQPGAQLANGATIPTGLQIGTGAAPIATTRIHKEGSLEQTDQSLDMAISGDGFFRVALPDGTIAYTRNGQFHRDKDGNIATPEGYLMDPVVTIPSTALKITITTGGLVQYYVLNQPEPITVGTIQLATFINPPGLESIGSNLYLPTDASGDPLEGNPETDTRGSIRSGFLEVSNVNVTIELVILIKAQRSFDMNVRAITTVDHMLQKLSQL